MNFLQFLAAAHISRVNCNEMPDDRPREPAYDTNSLKLVDQSLPNFFAQCRRKRCRSNSFPILDIFICSGDIRAQSGKGSEIGPKLACFLPPKFFGGQSPKFLNRRYKIEHASEHDAKFCSDWPRDLGEKKELQ